MALALVNGVRVSYRQVGEGPDVVLVHGLAANMAFWRLDLVRRLAARFSVTMWDLRGHGGSDMPASGYTSADLAGDLGALLDHLGIARAHLVGHSFGGAVALHCAALRPERVASLVLADAVIPALAPYRRLRDWPLWERWAGRLAGLGLEVSGDLPIDQGLLELMARPEWQRAREAHDGGEPFFLPFAGWNAGKRGAEQWLRLLRTTTARADFSEAAGLVPERIARIELPVLAVYGEHSHCRPVGDWLAYHLPDCRAAVSPGAGHYHPLVRPAFFEGELERFLCEVSGGLVGSGASSAKGERT